MLTFEELLRICRVMAELGIRKIKVSGGEPLVRKGAPLFIKSLKEIPGIEQITLTSNGLLLPGFLDCLAGLPSGAGRFLAGINVSLDTLSGDVFARLARPLSAGASLGPEKILEGIKQVRALHIPVKINCVPMAGINEESLEDIALLAKDTVEAVRFIELMPLGCASGLKPLAAGEASPGGFLRPAGIPGKTVRSILEKRFGPLARTNEKLGNGPAVYYRLKNFRGALGFIDALTGGFCENCNRLRLTPEGLLKPCLSSDIAVDLNALLRGGASDAELALVIKSLGAKKPASHSFSGIYGNKIEEHAHKDMFRIGG
jgi:cyclic pyranopterin phosphate synthase